MASRTDPVQFVRQVAAGSASRAQHSAVQAARVAAARRAAARHRATLAAATREEEAAQRREDDRLARLVMWCDCVAVLWTHVSVGAAVLHLEGRPKAVVMMILPRYGGGCVGYVHACPSLWPVMA